MSTIEDFKNAPVGATAINIDACRAMKIDDGKQRWVTPTGSYLGDEGMVYWNYTLDPIAPTTAREALALAWELAHEVKEGQVIPKGARYLSLSSSGLKEITAQSDFRITPGVWAVVRALEPLLEPEPDWLDAPAVLATCGCRGIELWQPHSEKDNMWVNMSGEHALWSTLHEVTPLYPKEDGEWVSL